MLNTIFIDLNTRTKGIDESDSMVVYDTVAIIQSLSRLVNTERGEIPNYRAYGLPLKRYLHYPLTTGSAREILQDIYDQIDTFEDRVEVLDDYSKVIVDLDNGYFKFNIVVKSRETGKVIELPVINIRSGLEQ